MSCHATTYGSLRKAAENEPTHRDLKKTNMPAFGCQPRSPTAKPASCLFQPHLGSFPSLKQTTTISPRFLHSTLDTDSSTPVQCLSTTPSCMYTQLWGSASLHSAPESHPLLIVDVATTCLLLLGRSVLSMTPSESTSESPTSR